MLMIIQIHWQLIPMIIMGIVLIFTAFVLASGNDLILYNMITPVTIFISLVVLFYVILGIIWLYGEIQII